MYGEQSKIIVTIPRYNDVRDRSISDAQNWWWDIPVIPETNSIPWYLHLQLPKAPAHHDPLYQPPHAKTNQSSYWKDECWCPRTILTQMDGNGQRYIFSSFKLMFIIYMHDANGYQWVFLKLRGLGGGKLVSFVSAKYFDILFVEDINLSELFYIYAYFYTTSKNLHSNAFSFYFCFCDCYSNLFTLFSMQPILVVKFPKTFSILLNFYPICSCIFINSFKIIPVWLSSSF